MHTGESVHGILNNFLKMETHFVLFVLSTVVFSATAYNGDLNVPGIPLRDIKALLRSTPEACNSPGFSCKERCKSPVLQYCAAEGENATVKSCSDNKVCAENSGGAPTCVESGDALCKVAVFECPEANKFYPNLANCNRYYFCNETKLATPMICPQDFVYDPLRHNCGPQNQGLRCHTVQCSEKELQVHPYPGDKSLFAICMLGELKMKECPDPEEFSPSESKCTLTCRGRGKFPYRNDCRKFYHCEHSNAKAVPDECAEGASFNSSNQSCEPGKCKD